MKNKMTSKGFYDWLLRIAGDDTEKGALLRWRIANPHHFLGIKEMTGQPPFRVVLEEYRPLNPARGSFLTWRSLDHFCKVSTPKHITAQSILDAYLYLVTSTKFNGSLSATIGRYIFDVKDLSAFSIQTTINHIVSLPKAKRINYSWVAPLQDFLISLEEEDEKQWIKHKKTRDRERGVPGDNEAPQFILNNDEDDRGDDDVRGEDEYNEPEFHDEQIIVDLADDSPITKAVKSNAGWKLTESEKQRRFPSNIAIDSNGGIYTTFVGKTQTYRIYNSGTTLTAPYLINSVQASDLTPMERLLITDTDPSAPQPPLPSDSQDTGF